MSIIKLNEAKLETLSTAQLLAKYLTLTTLLKKVPSSPSKKKNYTQFRLLKKKIDKELTKRGLIPVKFKQSMRYFLPFQIKNPYIVITGSVLYGTPHDLDVMILTPTIINCDPIASLIPPKLNAYFPPKTHWINSYYAGPFSSYVPIYNLELRPKYISRKFAPMYPKHNGKPLKIDLNRILSRLPDSVLIWKNLVHYNPGSHSILIPQLPHHYYVPLFIRLLRLFPVELRPIIKTYKQKFTPKNAIPVYDLILRKSTFQVVEMKLPN